MSITVSGTSNCTQRDLSELVPEARIAVAHGQMGLKEPSNACRRLLARRVRCTCVHNHY